MTEDEQRDFNEWEDEYFSNHWIRGDPEPSYTVTIMCIIGVAAGYLLIRFI
ncbi:hypothetical protein KAR91_53075 [Candidatus Pacearchaeota archaeon]|nr:hypothetical protein [Candidatus Pacearchaeota archaeon]